MPTDHDRHRRRYGTDVGHKQQQSVHATDASYSSSLASSSASSSSPWSLMAGLPAYDVQHVNVDAMTDRSDIAEPVSHAHHARNSVVPLQKPWTNACDTILPHRPDTSLHPLSVCPSVLTISLHPLRTATFQQSTTFAIFTQDIQQLFSDAALQISFKRQV